MKLDAPIKIEKPTTIYRSEQAARELEMGYNRFIKFINRHGFISTLGNENIKGSKDYHLWTSEDLDKMKNFIDKQKVEKLMKRKEA